MVYFCFPVKDLHLTFEKSPFLWLFYFSAAKKPSVAAIDGVAFGGALEIAMVQSEFFILYVFSLLLLNIICYI